MKTSKLNPQELAKLETVSNWSVSNSSKKYNKVYWLSNDGDEITINNNVYSVVKDSEKLSQFGSNLQAVLLKNGKLEHNYHSTGKQYIIIEELENDECVMAFLPAYNKQ